MTCAWCGNLRSVKPVKVDGRTTYHLCAMCWGIYKETGQRPPRYRMRDPSPVAGQGVALDFRRLTRG